MRVPASTPSPRWSRVVHQVHDGPLFGWSHVEAWWTCSCSACIDATLNGRPTPHPRQREDPA